MKNTNYSYKTSLPAYNDNAEGKNFQKNKILEEMKRLGGSACLKQIEKAMHLPQSTCSGRMNDLIDDGKVIHNGYIEFEKRLRKRFVLVQQKTISIIQEPIIPGQQELKFGT